MNSRYLIFGFAVLFLLNTINGQSYMEIAEKIYLNKGPILPDWDISRVSDCDPDSILFFRFVSQSDSMLDVRRVFHKYGNESKAIYEYEFNDESGELKLITIDSTVFDLDGRPVLHELWEFDPDSNRLFLEKRSHYYPHDGVILKDYSFYEDMINELNNGIGAFTDYDSLIIYKRDFITGILELKQKIIHVYSSEGYLEEVYDYRFDGLDMSWTPKSKQNIYYTSSNRIERIENFYWSSISSYNLGSTSIYIYDSNDSLESIFWNNSFEPGQRRVMTYNPVENSISSQLFSWDFYTGMYTEITSLDAKFDELSRIEILELKFNLLGDISELLYEYVYIGDEICPQYKNSYIMGEGEWNFDGRIYFYPFIFTSTYDIQILEWSAYPNPTNDGIWVEAPIGSQVQISTLLGNIIYKGQITDEREFISLNQINTQVILTIKNNSSSSSRVIIVNK